MRVAILGLLLGTVLLAKIVPAAEPEHSAMPTSRKVFTGKERLSDNASDEQRVDDCNVAPGAGREHVPRVVRGLSEADACWPPANSDEGRPLEPSRGWRQGRGRGVACPHQRGWLLLFLTFPHPHAINAVIARSCIIWLAVRPRPSDSAAHGAHTAASQSCHAPRNSAARSRFDHRSGAAAVAGTGW